MNLRSNSILTAASLAFALAFVACDNGSGSAPGDGTGGQGGDTSSGGDASTGGTGSSGGIGGSGGSPAGGAPGSGATAGGGGTAVEADLEIFSWWTTSGEAAALDALVDVFHESHPDTNVVNEAATNPATARQVLKNRLAAGEPPDCFQALSGFDLGVHVAQGQLTPLDDLAAEGQWSTAFPDEVLSTVSSAGKVYAVPLVVERENNTYCNTTVLEENQVAPPESLQEFYAACETLQDNGVTPLALPAAGWMMALTAFETLMPTVSGGDFYMKFLSGNADLSAGSADRAELVALFTEFDDVLSCSNIAQADGSWPSALDAVIAGDAAMAVMGDWGKHYLEQQGPWTAGNQFDVVPALGSSGYYVFNAAVFPLAKGAPHPAAGSAFLSVMASEAGQLAFCEKKDAVPARLGVSLDGFDAMTRANAESYAAAAAGSNKLLPGYASLVSVDFQLEMNPALLVFAVGGERAKELDEAVPDSEVVIPQGNIDYIVTKIAANYGLL